jgi:selenocysteine lyase/cysteine desulfurase
MSGTRYLARLGDRSLFPELTPHAYLNHAAVSAVSVPVRKAAEEVLADYEQRGLHAIERWIPQRTQLKAKLGSLIGAQGAELALLPGTSWGVVAVALSFPWKPGDRVLLFDGEFPANVTPWQRAAELFELHVERMPLVSFARHPDEGMEALEAHLKKGVRLVASSAVQFQTGLRMPLKRIAGAAHAHGAELFVDGIQAVGALPLDVKEANVDYLAGGGHKWLMGIEGLGYLYAPKERASALRRNVAGWLSAESPVDFLTEGLGKLDYDKPIREGIDFLELGSLSAVGAGALEAAIDLIDQLGVPAIFEHATAYLDQLEEGLDDRGFRSLRSPVTDSRSLILSMLPPDEVDVVSLNRALSANGVSTSIPDGRLRFSPHWPNAHDEVTKVLESVDQALKSL